MKIYYQVCFTYNGKNIIKRFDDLTAASSLCDKVGGFIRLCREKIRIDWRGVMA